MRKRRPKIRESRLRKESWLKRRSKRKTLSKHKRRWQLMPRSKHKKNRKSKKSRKRLNRRGPKTSWKTWRVRSLLRNMRSRKLIRLPKRQIWNDRNSRYSSLVKSVRHKVKRARKRAVRPKLKRRNQNKLVRVQNKRRQFRSRKLVFQNQNQRQK